MIKCNEAQFNVHRVIVCPRSAILRAMLDGSFKVIEIKCCCWTCADFAKETESGMRDLSEDDQCIVGFMLDYLYTADYDGSESIFEGLDKSAAGQSSLNKDIEDHVEFNTFDSFEDLVLVHGSIALRMAEICHMRIHVRVWAMGDRYDIASLRALAEDKFEDCLNSDYKAISFSRYSPLTDKTSF